MPHPPPPVPHHSPPQVRVCEDRAPAALDTLWEAMGTRPCSFAAQMRPGRYLLTYTATDKYGAKGVLVRTLLVLQRCPNGEVSAEKGRGRGGEGVRRVSSLCGREEGNEAWIQRVGCWCWCGWAGGRVQRSGASHTSQPAGRPLCLVPQGPSPCTPAWWWRHTPTRLSHPLAHQASFATGCPMRACVPQVQCPDGTCSDIGCLDYDPAAILGGSPLSDALQGDTAGVSVMGVRPYTLLPFGLVQHLSA